MASHVLPGDDRVPAAGEPERETDENYGDSHKYKGVTLSKMQTVEIYDALPKWKVRDNDVYIVTYPKSGTHWIYEIAHLLLHDLDLSKIDRNQMDCALDFALLVKEDGRDILIPHYKTMETWPSPRVLRTHVLEEFCPPEILSKNPKIIYLVRNPKDVVVSLFKFSESFLPPSIGGWGGYLSIFLSEDMTCGTWFRHVKGWWKHRDKPNILFCTYEDLHKDLRGNIKRIAEFMERPLSESDLDKMVELTTMKGMQMTYQKIEDDLGEEGRMCTRLFGHFPHLRKGKVGGWKDHFTVEQNELFDRVYREKMEGSGIHVEFEI